MDSTIPVDKWFMNLVWHAIQGFCSIIWLLVAVKYNFLGIATALGWIFGRSMMLFS